MEKNNIKVKSIVLSSGGDSLLPFVLVYMLYIIMHGHLSPLGGFHCVLLFVAAVLLIYFAHGYKTTTQAISFNLLHGGEGFASTVYVLLALLGVAAGAQFCQNVIAQGRIGDLYSAGTIFWMNVTVGLKVLTGIGSITLLMLSLVADREGGDSK